MLPHLPAPRAVVPRHKHELLAVVGSLRSKLGPPDFGVELCDIEHLNVVCAVTHIPGLIPVCFTGFYGRWWLFLTSLSGLKAL